MAEADAQAEDWKEQATAAGLQDDAAEEQEEADFTGDAKASDSESSDDGPPLDAYWASMLNVSKTAEPLPPPKMLSKEELEQQKRRGDGRRGKGKGKGKYGPYGMPGKGWKGKGGKPLRSNDIGDFVAWARDPDAADGSRQRPRSRSPRRQGQAEGLEGFMSWAREDQGVKEEQPEGPEDGLDSFLAWATEPSKLSVDSRRSSQDRQKVKQSEAVLPGDPYTILAAKLDTKKEKEEEEEAFLTLLPPPPPPPSLPVAEPEVEQKLIVPKELEDELRAAEDAPAGSKRERSKRERDSDDESDGGD